MIPLKQEGPILSSLPPLNEKELNRHRLANLLQTALFVAAILSLLCSFAYLLLGTAGLWVGFWFVILFFFIGVQTSPNLVLGFHKARPIFPQDAPALYAMTHSLAVQASIPGEISLYCTPGSMLNAFSTGTRAEPCIAVSKGLLNALNRRELTGVLAHEIAHLANGDLKIMVLSHLIGKAISFFALLGQILIWINLPFIITGELVIPVWFICLIGIGPTIMQLIHLKLSRIREYNADIIAVKLTQDPEGLSSALRKIGHLHRSLLDKILPQANKTTEPPEWLSTHPPTEERIKKIQKMIKTDKKHWYPQPPFTAAEEEKRGLFSK